jgi:ribonuclease VapC
MLGLFDDAAAGRVSLHMSWINLGEVYYIVARAAGEHVAARRLETIRTLPLRLHEADSRAVLGAAGIKAARRLSYADAFAVHLARELGAELITGDPEILALTDMVRVFPLVRQ